MKNSKIDVQEYLQNAARLTEETLEKLLPPEDTKPASIHSVMRYSVFAGGKRIRPALVLASHEACGGAADNSRAALAGAALEMLHTFSLMHDDLPCMDDDDYRRGRPTAHRAFNEAIAVLGGDALCIYAFEILADVGNCMLIKEIAQALGTGGMIGGQLVDMESEGKEVNREVVEYIHHNKTAALLRAAVRTGAILADASSETLDALSSYGMRIGLAFQVVDDILDEEGTTEQLGKDAGSDRERGKATFPAVSGMEESKRYARWLVEAATDDISFLGEKGGVLIALAEYIRTRIS